MTNTSEVTVVGGGIAGLVAAITAAEGGAPVVLYEAHARLGGRARSTEAPYLANDGPHVFYGDGPLWAWLGSRGLARPYRRLTARAGMGVRFRYRGAQRVSPPAGVVRALLHRRRSAPVDVDFRSWVGGRYGPAAAEAFSMLAAVSTFTADPGRLSAAFVWERALRGTDPTGGPRYVDGGWGAVVDRLAAHAWDLGVRVETGARVDTLPAGPTVVATALPAARRLLGRPLPTPATSGSTLLLDAAVRRRRGDRFIVSDLDAAGWVEDFSLVDGTLAPAGVALVQAQRPPRPAESRVETSAALEELVAVAFPGWQDRLLWRRSGVAEHRSGALDLPGYTWRDRPAVDQGDGVFLAGDEVAAPGILSEVSWASAVQAGAAGARLAAAAPRTVHAAFAQSVGAGGFTGGGRREG